MASNAQSAQTSSQVATSPQAPPASPIDVYSLEAPAGVEQPYLARMVPLNKTENSSKDDVAVRSVGSYGMGWSIVQGPPSLFATGSPWVGWRQ